MFDVTFDRESREGALTKLSQLMNILYNVPVVVYLTFISGASVNEEQLVNRFAKAYADRMFTSYGESGSIKLPIGPEAAILPVMTK